MKHASTNLLLLSLAGLSILSTLNLRTLIVYVTFLAVVVTESLILVVRSILDRIVTRLDVLRHINSLLLNRT